MAAALQRKLRIVKRNRLPALFNAIRSSTIGDGHGKGDGVTGEEPEEAKIREGNVRVVLAEFDPSDLFM